MTSSSATSHTQQIDQVSNSRGPRGRKASVVIPTYNHAHYVGDAIQSVLDQTYDNYEIIVVDDGSQDNTHQIVADFGNQVRYIWQENQGLSAARNTGIRAAEGELIGLLDADDLYEPDFLSTLAFTLEANPSADAVYCGCRFVDETNRPLPQYMGRVVPPEELHNTLLNGGFFAPLCMFANKYCYEQLGYFDRSFQGCADLDMWLRISDRYVVIGTEAVLARYRVAPQSMSSDPAYMLNDRIAVLQRHFGNESSEIAESTLVQRLAYGRSYLTAASEYLQLHDIEQTYQSLCQAFNTSPELVGELDVFYELGCGDQPRGYRGDFTTLNRQHNSQVLMDLLDRVFDDPQISSGVKSRQRLAYANAYFALGLLSYGARDFRDTRRFLTRAVASNPRLGLQAQVASIWLKSLLKARFIEQIKRRHSRMAAH
jgi:hypothetical protein